MVFVKADNVNSFNCMLHFLKPLCKKIMLKFTTTNNEYLSVPLLKWAESAYIQN